MIGWVCFVTSGRYIIDQLQKQLQFWTQQPNQQRQNKWIIFQTEIGGVSLATWRDVMTSDGWVSTLSLSLSCEVDMELLYGKLAFRVQTKFVYTEWMGFSFIM